jgi:fumarate reductase subunit D
MRYRTLDSKLIIETAERLEKRVADRFPDAGLRGVAIELVSLSRDLAKAAKALEAPIWWLRGIIISAIAAGALMFLFVGTILPLGRISGSHDAIQSVQGIESSINVVILAVLGFLALIRTEERIKRRRVFRKLHGLRSLIHVIDMHQLTKDPAVL